MNFLVRDLTQRRKIMIGIYDCFGYGNVSEEGEAMGVSNYPGLDRNGKSIYWFLCLRRIINKSLRMVIRL